LRPIQTLGETGTAMGLSPSEILRMSQSATTSAKGDKRAGHMNEGEMMVGSDLPANS
jgi:hypothetical protein